MLHGSPQQGVGGSELTRILSRLADAQPDLGRMKSVQRLAHWLGWTGAIALSGALEHRGATSGQVRPDIEAEEAEFARVQAVLARAIDAGPQEPASMPNDFTPIRRHCLAQQHAMQVAIGALRARLRRALARRSASGNRLASIDEVLDRALAPKERQLLGVVILRLQTHFERLQRAGVDEARWRHAFRVDMDRVLHAELTHRLLPAHGLLETLRRDSAT